MAMRNRLLECPNCGRNYAPAPGWGDQPAPHVCSCGVRRCAVCATPLTPVGSEGEGAVKARLYGAGSPLDSAATGVPAS